ncbi:uncharacterized protein NEMAJ01_0141 [Nematocida major]|uniref:uncharacterized protein n=1 Tax=Nematocida major TaxID=1912982 RepID=UPI002008DB0B|nr:uncharacterized protein NEMAJ01_0141 [Nematocida major]KAH9385245.1 hypothetical protein NEMAJ01_0141 [Nematocida major]
MRLKISSLEVLKLSPENSLQCKYTLHANADILWKDIQCLCQGRKYKTAYECAEHLRNIACKDTKTELYRRCMLIMARLAVIQSHPDAGALYIDLIRHAHSREFVYTTPYSYNIEVFKQAEAMASPYRFLFEEYLANIKKPKKNTGQETLFYRLIDVHTRHKSPWDHEESLDLSLLPAHVRNVYVEYTANIAYPRARGRIHVNMHNSREFKHRQEIYKDSGV